MHSKKKLANIRSKLEMTLHVWASMRAIWPLGPRGHKATVDTIYGTLPALHTHFPLTHIYAHTGKINTIYSTLPPCYTRTYATSPLVNIHLCRKINRKKCPCTHVYIHDEQIWGSIIMRLCLRDSLNLQHPIVIMANFTHWLVAGVPVAGGTQS